MTAIAPAAPRALPASSGLTVQTVGDYQEFLALETVWGRVLGSAGLENPFLEFTWIRTWWECFGAGSNLNIVLVRDGDEVVAIAPLILTPVRLMGVPLRQLGFFYNDHVPRADFIVAEGRPDAYRAIWRHIKKQKNWDLLLLCQLLAYSPTLAKIANAAETDGHPTGLWPSSDSPFTPLDLSWTEYAAGLPAKHRSNLRNRFKRLNALASVEMETVNAADDLESAIEDGVRLEAAAWKGAEGTAISCSADLRRFYTLFAQRAAERGWLRMHFLLAQGRRVAFDYSLEYLNHIFLLKQGYDPAYAAYSPSNLLLSMELEQVSGREGACFDFLGDSADWKRCWARNTNSHWWLYVFAKGPKGRLAHFLKFSALPLAKRIARKK